MAVSSFFDYYYYYYYLSFKIYNKTEKEEDKIEAKFPNF